MTSISDAIYDATAVYGAGVLFLGGLGGYVHRFVPLFLQGFHLVARFSRSVDSLPFRLRNGHS